MTDGLHPVEVAAIQRGRVATWLRLKATGDNRADLGPYLRACQGDEKAMQAMFHQLQMDALHSSLLYRLFNGEEPTEEYPSRPEARLRSPVVPAKRPDRMGYTGTRCWVYRTVFDVMSACLIIAGLVEIKHTWWGLLLVPVWGSILFLLRQARNDCP